MERESEIKLRGFKRLSRIKGGGNKVWPARTGRDERGAESEEEEEERKRRAKEEVLKDRRRT